MSAWAKPDRLAARFENPVFAAASDHASGGGHYRIEAGWIAESLRRNAILLVALDEESETSSDMENGVLRLRIAHEGIRLRS